MEPQQTETININHHIRLLVIKALNTSNNQLEAADKLNVTVRSLQHYIKQYEVKQTNSVWD